MPLNKESDPNPTISSLHHLWVNKKEKTGLFNIDSLE